MNNNLTSLTLAGCLLVTGAANAGSLVVVEPEPVPIAPIVAPAFAWDGAYAGVVLGYGEGMYTNGVSVLDEIGVDIDVNGAIYGAKLGYNFQSGSTVYGVEADITNGPTGLTPQGTAGPDWWCGTGDCYANIDAVATIRGRAGVLASSDFLIYGTAGIAIAQVTGGIVASPQDGGGTAYGAVGGVGAEYAVGSSASVGAEYLYYGLSPIPFGDDGSGNTFDGVGSFGVARLFFNFHF